METKTYSCDKCKSKVDNQKNLLSIEVRLKSYRYDSSYRQKLEVELCPSCAEKLGLIKRVVKGDAVVNEPQDTKDKLYNVIVQLIQETGIQVEY